MPVSILPAQVCGEVRGLRLLVRPVCSSARPRVMRPVLERSYLLVRPARRQGARPTAARVFKQLNSVAAQAATHPAVEPGCLCAGSGRGHLRLIRPDSFTPRN